jgi:hypothetical protein
MKKLLLLVFLIAQLINVKGYENGQAYRQCGGYNYNGPKNCLFGYVCVWISASYGQCCLLLINSNSWTCSGEIEAHLFLNILVI